MPSCKISGAIRDCHPSSSSRCAVWWSATPAMGSSTRRKIAASSFTPSFISVSTPKASGRKSDACSAWVEWENRTCRGTPSSGQFPRPAFTRRFPCVRRGSRLSAAQNPPPVFPRKTSAGGFGLAQGIAFTEEHALFRFRQFLHRFDDFGDGAHGPKLWLALAVGGKGMKKARHPRRKLCDDFLRVLGASKFSGKSYQAVALNAFPPLSGSRQALTSPSRWRGTTGDRCRRPIAGIAPRSHRG